MTYTDVSNYTDDMAVAAEILDYWTKADIADARDERQNTEALDLDRFVDYSDVDRPDDMLVSATNGHVWHVSPGAEDDRWN